MLKAKTKPTAIGRVVAWAPAWLFLVAALAMPGAARAQQEDGAMMLNEADWPCPGKYRLAFSAAEVWAGPPPGPETDTWRDDADVRALAERLASPETMSDRTPDMVAAFAARIAGDPARDARLTLLFRGVLDELNLFRRFILEGIVGFVARRMLAADALAGFESELDALPDDGAAATEKTRKTLAYRRFWTARVIEKSEGEARFQCQRLNALEGKLGTLARAIAGHLD